MSWWEIALLALLIGLFVLKAVAGFMAIDAGMELWYRRQVDRHRFRGWS